jgi:hypothetical protein
MNRSTIFIVCWAVLFTVFSLEPCRAGMVFFAAAEDCSALSEKEHFIAADTNDAASADVSGAENQKDLIGWAKPFGECNAPTDADGTISWSEADGYDGVPKAKAENNDLPAQNYLLIILVGAAAGLTLISAGIVQWWLHRSLRKNWLFPTIQDGEAASDLTSTPAPLIAKKQIEELPEEKTKKSALRRAA